MEFCTLGKIQAEAMQHPDAELLAKKKKKKEEKDKCVCFNEIISLIVMNMRVKSDFDE